MDFQTCSVLNDLVSDDKQLWLYIFYRDIRLPALPSPRLTRPLDTITAREVIEWVKNGIILNRNYLSGCNDTLFRYDMSMHVTWTKLVRSRWLLVACSNLHLSKLVLWDLNNMQHESYKSTFHFSGPLTEALLEDDGSEILIALTIGSKYVIR